jgi:sporulation protein YlmC with PRC-barrel domain
MSLAAGRVQYFFLNQTGEISMLLSASSITGDGVRNHVGEDLGQIEDLMIDVNNGKVAYAVLSFGGFLGLGDKLFAVPIEAMTVDTDDKCFVLSESKERLEKAPGFDKDNWPNFADTQWQSQVRSYYRV